MKPGVNGLEVVGPHPALPKGEGKGEGEARLEIVITIEQGGAQPYMKPGGVDCFLVIDIRTVSVTDSKIEVVSGVDKIAQGEVVVDDGGTQALAYVVIVFVGTVVVVGFKDVFAIIETVFVFTIECILEFITEVDAFVMVFDEADAFIKISSHGMG